MAILVGYIYRRVLMLGGVTVHPIVWPVLHQEMKRECMAYSRCIMLAPVSFVLQSMDKGNILFRSHTECKTSPELITFI